MKIIIVEDNVENMTNAYYATKAIVRSGYDYPVPTVEIVSDLDGFHEVLKDGNIMVVYTDICFNETGAYGHHNPFSNDIEFLKNKKEVKTSDILRKQVIKASFQWSDYVHSTGVGMDATKQEEIELRNTNLFLDGSLCEAVQPALGYIVIKECQKRNIPYRFHTSLGHGGHVIPALLASGAISEEEAKGIKNHLDRGNKGDIFLGNGVVTNGSKNLGLWENLFLNG